MLSVSLLVIYVLAREETIALLVDTCGELFLPQQSDIGVSQIMSRYNSVSLSYTAVPGLLFFFCCCCQARSKCEVLGVYVECSRSVKQLPLCSLLPSQKVGENYPASS